MRSLVGAVALVTGASSGIGEATARRLAREGAAVELVDSPPQPQSEGGFPNPGVSPKWEIRTAWLIVLAAITFEVAATLSLKAGVGLARQLPLVAVVIGYVASFALFGLALRTLSVGPVHAVWSAPGTTAALIGGAMPFGERLWTLTVIGVVVIVFGVMILGVAESSVT